MTLKVLTYVRRNVIALLALFVALGGTSYAALSLPRGSVGTRQLRNGAVTNRKLARHSVDAVNLNPKSIAGHIAAWAQISASSQVISSSPRATIVNVTQPGFLRVTWQRPIAEDCIAVANPTNTGLARATVQTFGPENPHGAADFVVQTFDSGGAQAAEGFNIVVICP